ncbi:MAG: diiron oxygenase [Neisseria sp.]|uniref:diiron oxygenase n=1 Tax=Neisseria sp. TaxID=192066 RepID=UPI0026DDADC9|nr:diiron oxygenase [Neisseria sp.]MDO4641053.1 diiron oxygenase [Neisseria sp.]
MMNSIKQINKYAHLNYLHPNRMPWEEAATDGELDFLSRVILGQSGQEEKAIAYLYKELAQLAEIEMHVATVMSRVLCELQGESTPLIMGDGLYHSISCFASEEINHANSFYQYVRNLSGADVKLKNNFSKERIELYNDNDSPLIKLAALCSTAYVGESIITVFERRLKVLDPMQHSFLTRLLHFHGLDEARHIKFDHAVFDQIIPTFSNSERKRMHQLIQETESLNTQLAIASEETVKAAFDIDYTEGNLTAKTQLDMTLRFREIVQSGETIRKVDDYIDDETEAIIHQFSQASKVHATQFSEKL